MQESLTYIGISNDITPNPNIANDISSLHTLLLHCNSVNCTSKVVIHKIWVGEKETCRIMRMWGVSFMLVEKHVNFYRIANFQKLHSFIFADELNLLFMWTLIKMALYHLRTLAVHPRLCSWFQIITCIRINLWKRCWFSFCLKTR